MSRDVRMIPLDRVRPNPLNARTHSNRQIQQIADSIRAFGFAAPVLIDEGGMLLAGHARVQAAKLLGQDAIPALMIEGLSAVQKRALLLADNKIAENAGWDRERLAIELPELSELLVSEGLDISITGFEPVEIDQIHIDFEEHASDPADEFKVGAHGDPVISQRNDLWILGNHRLLCGDARREADLARLMGDRRAAMGFLDPPYNVSIRQVVGRGRTKHPDFAMACGEMSDFQYTGFLREALEMAARFSKEASLHFVCIDWRHLEHLHAAAKIYGTMLNLVVWVKSNAGQGSFYRSQHELIGVFRVGRGTHLNNVELGRHGRSRSNVWSYPGVNAFRAGRLEELTAHPTVKPVALVADAMKDCTRRGDIVLDTFGGSGTTILGAERVGRQAYVVEIAPSYVDVAIRRWQAFTHRDALHLDSGRSFDQTAAQRTAERASVGTRRRR